MTDGPTIRRAGPADAAAIADLYVVSYRSVYDFPLSHSEEEIRHWLGDLVASEEAWVAEADDVVIGFMALTEDRLDQLYLHPGQTGRGIGGRLLDLAKERRPDGFELYTFQVNSGARRFYERRGLVVVDMDDGARNEEHQPDVRYAWRPA